VVAPQSPEVMDLIRRVCAEKGAALIEVGRDVKWTARPTSQGEIVSVRGRLGVYSDVALPLVGAHQAMNAAVAVATLETLSEQCAGLSEDDIRRGFASVWWPGRLETIGLAPRIVVDGAHNVESMRRLGEALSTAFPHRRLIVVMGASLDKDVPGMAREIAPLADVFIATRSAHPRSVETEALAGEARQYPAVVREVGDVASALRLALTIADKDDLICATGSLFVVAEAREAMGLTSASDRFQPGPHETSGR
jgi:dihydrofolate synthase / folylpolyglutamate synthase